MFKSVIPSFVAGLKYAPATTIGSLKEIVLAHYPQDKDNAPKIVNDLKLLNVGNIF